MGKEKIVGLSVLGVLAMTMVSVAVWRLRNERSLAYPAIDISGLPASADNPSGTPAQTASTRKPSLLERTTSGEQPSSPLLGGHDDSQVPSSVDFKLNRETAVSSRRVPNPPAEMTFAVPTPPTPVAVPAMASDTPTSTPAADPFAQVAATTAPVAATATVPDQVDGRLQRAPEAVQLSPQPTGDASATLMPPTVVTEAAAATNAPAPPTAPTAALTEPQPLAAAANAQPTAHEEPARKPHHHYNFPHGTDTASANPATAAATDAPIAPTAEATNRFGGNQYDTSAYGSAGANSYSQPLPPPTATATPYGAASADQGGAGVAASQEPTYPGTTLPMNGPYHPSAPAADSTYQQQQPPHGTHQHSTQQQSAQQQSAPANPHQPPAHSPYQLPHHQHATPAQPTAPATGNRPLHPHYDAYGRDIQPEADPSRARSYDALPQQQSNATGIPSDMPGFGSQADLGHHHGSHSGEAYTVQPNDSYWTIAERVYGSGKYFKALEEHNRERVPNSGKLRVGDQVATPSIETLERQYADLTPKRRNPPAQPSLTVPVSARNSEHAGRVYKVRQGDTLFDIARYELGKASRWSEIYELNRDRLGDDFDFLTPGTELLLPNNSTINGHSGPKERAPLTTRSPAGLQR
ncbi:MAG: LysM peptidoglycan-binding domain-containing protein [Planctomycetes bacterium]|nr:LysM peptidoglycan-binding domain-containing protein [Planctomycetota bacterium]